MTTPAAVRIVPLIHNGPKIVGDFGWMIEQPEYGRALFVFNDDEEHFRAFAAGSPTGFARGGGSAVIRPHRRAIPPRAAGVPTGRAGHGYDGLSPAVRRVVDAALDVVRALLATGNYDTVYLSRDRARDTLGTSTFEVADEVRDYVFGNLCRMGLPEPWEYQRHVENAYGEE